MIRRFHTHLAHQRTKLETDNGRSCVAYSTCSTSSLRNSTYGPYLHLVISPLIMIIPLSRSIELQSRNQTCSRCLHNSWFKFDQGAAGFLFGWVVVLLPHCFAIQCSTLSKPFVVHSVLFPPVDQGGLWFIRAQESIFGLALKPLSISTHVH